MKLIQNTAAPFSWVLGIPALGGLKAPSTGHCLGLGAHVGPSQVGMAQFVNLNHEVNWGISQGMRNENCAPLGTVLGIKAKTAHRFQPGRGSAIPECVWGLPYKPWGMSTGSSQALK